MTLPRRPLFRLDTGRRPPDLRALASPGRAGGVSDIPGAIALLASDTGARIAGTSLRIDGGWTADGKDQA